MEHDRKAIFAALLANVGVAVAKFVGFALTGAASLLAEAIHSVADSANQLLLFFGGHRAQRRPTVDHPFGFGAERYFWAFIVALVLFVGGGVFALYEAEEKLRHPHELESPVIAIGILLLSAMFEAFSLRTAVRASRDAKGDQSWYRFIRTSKRAELPVVLLEDFGALIGLALALVGVSLSAITGESTFDALGSAAIGILLVVIALTLAVEMKSLLIGESATKEQRVAIAAVLAGAPRVSAVLDLRTLQLSPDELLIVARIELPGDMETVDVATTIDELEAGLRAAVPEANAIYLSVESLSDRSPAILAPTRRRRVASAPPRDPEQAGAEEEH